MITTIIYLFSFIEIKNFFQIFLKSRIYTFLWMFLKVIDTCINFLFTVPLDRA